MKKFALFLFTIVFTFNSALAEEIKWTVERNTIPQENNQSVIMKTEPSKFGNTDLLKVPVKQPVTSPVSRNNSTSSTNFSSNLNAAVSSSLQPVSSKDPFVIKIDGIKYYMVQNNTIVGQNSTLENIYEPLYKMDKNKDQKLTSQEMKISNIRFARLNKNGQLEMTNKTLDYPLTNISHIDLKTLRKTNNIGKLGSFGYFDIYINQDNQQKRFIGQIAYEDEQSINKLLGK